MRADLIGAVGGVGLLVGDVDVGVVADDVVAVGKQPVVCTPRGALPLELRAEPRARYAAGLPQPGEVALDVVQGHAADGKLRPVLARAPVPAGVGDRLVLL